MSFQFDFNVKKKKWTMAYMEEMEYCPGQDYVIEMEAYYDQIDRFRPEEWDLTQYSGIEDHTPIWQKNIAFPRINNDLNVELFNPEEEHKRKIEENSINTARGKEAWETQKRNKSRREEEAKIDDEYAFGAIFGTSSTYEFRSEADERKEHEHENQILIIE